MKKTKREVVYVTPKEWESYVKMGATVEEDNSIVGYEQDEKGSMTGVEFLIKCKQNLNS